MTRMHFWARAASAVSVPVVPTSDRHNEAVQTTMAHFKLWVVWEFSGSTTGATRLTCQY